MSGRTSRWTGAALAVGLWVLLPGGLPAGGQTPSGRSYYAYVCAESDDQVSLVRFGPDGLEVVRTVTVGSFPSEIEGPHGIAVAPDGKHWFVSLSHGNPFGSVHKYETGTDEWVELVTVGMFPASMDISRTTGLLYVVNFDLYGDMKPSSLSVVDTTSMAEVARIPHGIMPHGSRLDRAGARQYAVSMMGDELIEVDALRFEVARRLPLSPHAMSAHDTAHGGTDGGMVMNLAEMVQPTWATQPTPQGKVYVAGNNQRVILEVDVERWEITRRFEETGNGPYNLDVTPDGRTLAVTYKKGAEFGLWDLESGREVARLETTRTVPHGVVVTPDGRYAFVTNEGVGGEPGTVEVYDIAARKRVASADVGKQAGGIAFWKMEP